ncbi:MAG: ATP-binding protein [Sphingomonas sp.]|jgi:two-component system osmolarity sensor histidine kinase EnvZ
MMRRLLDRNIATLVVVVLLGQMLAAALLYVLVLRPQSQRLAEVTAEMTDTIGKSMARMSPQERRALVARFNADDAVLIRPGDTPPKAGYRPAMLVERDFIAAISRRLNHGREVEWRTDQESRLWVRLWLGGEDWWVTLTPRRLRAPLASAIVALASALFAAITGGIALQRLIDKPLRRLVNAADTFDPDRPSAHIDEQGPEEIAAVASAFNRMTARLAAQEAERAVMLGAVSHDLRTPLTRLRLSLAMLGGADSEMLESAGRQVDRIDTMLGQFLDYARGFDTEPLARTTLAPLLHRVASDSELGEVLTVACATDIEANLRPAAVERAVANLVANARRYGRAPYRVEAGVHAGKIIIAVGDSGEGFDLSLAPALCRPFARQDTARSGDSTGLGLAIVERIASAHGGKLDFERRDGMFWARLTLL